MRRALLALGVAAVTLLTSACDTSPGVVTGRHTVTLGGTTHYIVTVKHQQSGKNLDEDVPPSVFTACTRGDKWPECGK